MILKLSLVIREFYEMNNIDLRGVVISPTLLAAQGEDVTDLQGHDILAAEDVTVGEGMDYLDKAQEPTSGSYLCTQDGQDQKEWLHNGVTAYNLNVCMHMMT